MPMPSTPHMDFTRPAKQESAQVGGATMSQTKGLIEPTNQHSSFSALLAIILSLMFAVVQAGSAQTVKQVFAFSSAHSSPTPGWVIPAQGRDGNLYGTTTGLGIVQSDGTVFKATTTGKEAPLHIFAGTD